MQIKSKVCDCIINKEKNYYIHKQKLVKETFWNKKGISKLNNFDTMHATLNYLFHIVDGRHVDVIRPKQFQPCVTILLYNLSNSKGIIIGGFKWVS